MLINQLPIKLSPPKTRGEKTITCNCYSTYQQMHILGHHPSGFEKNLTALTTSSTHSIFEMFIEGRAMALKWHCSQGWWGWGCQENNFRHVCWVCVCVCVCVCLRFSNLFPPFCNFFPGKKKHFFSNIL